MPEDLGLRAYISGKSPMAKLQLWTLSAMTSRYKNGRYSMGTLYGRPMERLAFRYDRHEEVTRYIQIRDIYYHPTVMHVFCLPLKNFVPTL